MRRITLPLVRVLVFVAMYASGCTSDEAPKQINRAFYFWRSGSRPKASELETLDKLYARILYVKFFDVVWDARANEVRPVAMLHLDTNFFPQSEEIIPVVFLTEEALVRSDIRDIPHLAAKIVDVLKAMSTSLGSRTRELQFDCDWTSRTRDKYFLLLSSVRRQFADGNHVINEPLILSATIRLHQVKYHEKTGVPPVDRGMLMFYNMSDWRSANTKNSIFDLDAASNYMDYIRDYPLPFDLALPIFRWILAYRNGHFFTILNSIGRKELETISFVTTIGTDRYRVTADTTMFGARFMDGDLLRTEACSASDLLTAEKSILFNIRNTNLRIALYHLDSASLSYYDAQTLDSIFDGCP